MQLGLALCAVLLSCWAPRVSVADPDVAPRPHIVVLLCDNVGWANVGFHRRTPTKEVQTPNIDELAGTGVELDRHYTYKFCSPSRSAFLSGRLPLHVNIFNDDPAMPGAGIPENMTVIASKLGTAGYQSHFIGKWHVGMATPRHTPEGRGFNSSLGYFHSYNHYWTEHRSQGCENRPFVDLWNTGKPGWGLNGTGPDGGFEEGLFLQRAQHVIASHDVTKPLFLYYALHISCVPLTAPKSYLDKFSFIPDPDRRTNHAMVNFMDDAVGAVVSGLKAKGMWNNTLLLWSSDNGGAVHLGGGANDFPLKGGYKNNWEGGVRVAAAVNGGFLPQAVRGTKQEGYIHLADWYATFCHLAGVDPTDHQAAAAGLPPIDSLNMWPLISGANSSSPRTEFSLTPFGDTAPHGGDAGYIMGDYKLLVGQVEQAGWCGEVHPNLTTRWNSFATVENCTDPSRGKLGCLFNIRKDPTEHHDLALDQPDIALRLFNRMLEVQKTFFNPDRGLPQQGACQQAAGANKGFWGPWLP